MVKLYDLAFNIYYNIYDINSTKEEKEMELIWIKDYWY